MLLKAPLAWIDLVVSWWNLEDLRLTWSAWNPWFESIVLSTNVCRWGGNWLKLPNEVGQLAVFFWASHEIWWYHIIFILIFDSYQSHLFLSCFIPPCHNIHCFEFNNSLVYVFMLIVCWYLQQWCHFSLWKRRLSPALASHSHQASTSLRWELNVCWRIFLGVFWEMVSWSEIIYR